MNVKYNVSNQEEFFSITELLHVCYSVSLLIVGERMLDDMYLTMKIC